MEERERQSPNRAAAEKAADGIEMQLREFRPEDVDQIVQRPHCLIYLVGFCIGVTDVFDREADEEVDPVGVTEGGIIWAFAGRPVEEYDRGNNIATDANELFIRMQLGNAEELRPAYELGVREGQAYAADNTDPQWLNTFVRDGLRA